jgi:vacuolar-type H+-ATPase subunit I/STV1
MSNQSVSEPTRQWYLSVIENLESQLSRLESELHQVREHLSTEIEIYKSRIKVLEIYLADDTRWFNMYQALDTYVKNLHGNTICINYEKDENGVLTAHVNQLQSRDEW